MTEEIEFDLGEARENIFNMVEMSDRERGFCRTILNFVKVQDKEFIRRLKEELYTYKITGKEILEIIDKLAGDKLTESKSSLHRKEAKA